MPADTSRAAAIAALEQRLGFTFDDRDLLTQSLTHAAKLGLGKGRVRHNERLEFLGDRVLGLAMARALYLAEPDADPELLTKRFSYLVSRETCAQIARTIGLPQAMDVPKAQGLRQNETAIADACEALIAAVFLDKGFERAAEVVLDLWSEAMRRPMDFNAANPKTALQIWAQSTGKPLPRYEVVERSGPPHAPVFTVQAMVEGYPPMTAVGGSRRDAEKAAAIALLQREGAA
jgi:ribonuclease-3